MRQDYLEKVSIIIGKIVKFYGASIYLNSY